MTDTRTFVIAPDGVVTTHADRQTAVTFAAYESVGTGTPAYVVFDEDDLPEGEQLQGLHAALNPDVTSDDGNVATRAMIFNQLLARYGEQPFFVDTPATDDASASGAQEGTTTMSEAQTAEAPIKPKAVKAPATTPAPKAKAATTPKTTAVPKPKAAAAPKEPKARVGKGKPAGKVAEFKQVAKGSKRGNILELMTGKHDSKAIGEKLGIPASLVSSNIFCLHRDCGIGHSYGAKGEITALFPAGKTLSDALKIAQPKTAKPAAAPKAAPKAKAKK